MNYICTWFCGDAVGEESNFPQSGKRSSGKAHQHTYWRCILVFFLSSKRFNKKERHVLFTNVAQLPVVNGISVEKTLEHLGVEVIVTPFEFKPPKGYYKSFQNQFYQFSILKEITLRNRHKKDNYLILDSDCIFIKSAQSMFEEAGESGFLSHSIKYDIHHSIHGLSRWEMKGVFEELLNKKLEDSPEYHMGEFYLCSVENTRKLFLDFLELWPQLLQRQTLGLKKFNEEAHTLSYLYYKNGLKSKGDEVFVKRMWTNPVFLRNVSPADLALTVWHLPAEKNVGFVTLFKLFFLKSRIYGYDLSDEEFVKVVSKTFAIPSLSANKWTQYYIKTNISRLQTLIANFDSKSFRKAG